MRCLDFKKEINGFKVDINIPTNTVFFSPSGTGISFLFSLIAHYCLENGISFCKIDEGSTDEVKNILIKNRKAVVIMLDNADLYLNTELMELLDMENSLVLIRAHGPVINFLKYNITPSSYRIEFDEEKFLLTYDR
ncbi:MAG: hypothetical protein IJX15_05870 [Ruminiclostridium sp.]|nr:hypothetical protein [Ruminiclostridium sp.]